MASDAIAVSSGHKTARRRGPRQGISATSFFHLRRDLVGCVDLNQCGSGVMGFYLILSTSTCIGASAPGFSAHTKREHEMRNFWMGLLVVTGVVVVAAAASSIWLFWRINQDTVTPVAVVNPDGRAGRALLVYQPGLSEFPDQITSAFADGMAAAGWQISKTTASAQAPVPDGKYDLVVLGSPVYFGAPAKPLARYVARAGDLGGKPVITLLTAAADFDTAVSQTEKMITAANGRPIRSLGFTTSKPNGAANKYSGSNTEKAVQYARDEGRAMSLAAR